MYLITSSSKHPNGHETGARGSDTGWLGIQGHGIGVREVPGSNTGGTTMIFAPDFPGEKCEGIRVMQQFHSIFVQNVSVFLYPIQYMKAMIMIDVYQQRLL